MYEINSSECRKLSNTWKCIDREWEIRWQRNDSANVLKCLLVACFWSRVFSRLPFYWFFFSTRRQNVISHFRIQCSIKIFVWLLFFSTVHLYNSQLHFCHSVWNSYECARRETNLSWQWTLFFDCENRKSMPMSVEIEGKKLGLRMRAL